MVDLSQTLTISVFSATAGSWPTMLPGAQLNRQIALIVTQQILMP
jgi:hypothetical protein